MTNGNPIAAIGPLLGTGVMLVAAKSVIDTTQELSGKKSKKKKLIKKEDDITSRALNKMLGKY